MRNLLCACVALGLLAIGSRALAADVKSGLQPGEAIGAFDVEKCGGNDTDGVENGAQLCYRCKLGNRPVVAVFARTPDEKLAKLMKELDKFVVHNEDQKAASFVNLLGKDADALKATSKKLVKQAGTQNIAVVVPLESENGPDHLKISPDADVTVLIYKQGKIEANHALAKGKLDDKAIASIIKDTDKITK